uniref:Beta-defensin n=1 Tax=Oncorhynchus tshawytscha TaxID=74940 RepID=A0AAZ3SD32_ONCTS
MRRLGLVMLVLLLLTSGITHKTRTQHYCYAQEYMVGYHGCPRRLRCCALRF